MLFKKLTCHCQQFLKICIMNQNIFVHQNNLNNQRALSESFATDLELNQPLLDQMNENRFLSKVKF